MAILRDRNDPVRLFMRRLGMLVVVFLAIAAGMGVWNVYSKERDSSELRARAEGELSDLKTQESRLRQNIATLETSRGKEEALRENYEVGRTGEGLIIIVEPPQPEPTVEESQFRQWVHRFLPFW